MQNANEQNPENFAQAQLNEAVGKLVKHWKLSNDFFDFDNATMTSLLNDVRDKYAIVSGEVDPGEAAEQARRNRRDQLTLAVIILVIIATLVAFAIYGKVIGL